MSVMIVVAITCWACVAVTRPGRPLPGNEVQELIYCHLLGRHQRMALIALVATGIAAFALCASLASHAGTAVEGTGVRDEHCNGTRAAELTCYRALPDGGWKAEQLQADGTWRVVGMWLPATEPTE